MTDARSGTSAAKPKQPRRSQGGGAHGAFTWGVLDRVLEDERLAIEAISGTSAGAMNAVVLADGLIEGGPEARASGSKMFWDGRSRDGGMAQPVQRTPFDIVAGRLERPTAFAGYLCSTP